MTATVTRVSGDTDITVQSGASLTFTTANWNVYQPVTLAAGNDVDTTNGTATIRVSASGIPNKDVTATEADDDPQYFITDKDTVPVPEIGTATFQVKLNAQPAATVTAAVTRVSGDTDITVQSGASLMFTTANWNVYQPVTLAAGNDVDATNGTATIRVSASGIPNKDVTATEADDDPQYFITDKDTVPVPEIGTATFQVKLNAQPAATVTAAVTRVSGDTDITVQSGASLTFTTANWNVYQPVTLAAGNDVDATNGTATIRVSASGIPNKDVTATEADDDPQYFITDKDTVPVPEIGTATFQVKLNAQPAATVTAAVTRVSGDTDITVQSGASLTFTTANWNVYQPVTLAAGNDVDATNGTATIRVSASGIPNKDVTATEADDDLSPPVFPANNKVYTTSKPLNSLYKAGNEYFLFYLDGYALDLMISDNGDSWDNASDHMNVISSVQSGQSLNYYAALLLDNGIYRAWHSATSDANIAGSKLYYSTSRNGITFSGTKVPVMTNGTYPTYDSRNINSPFVVKANNQYHLFYDAYPGYTFGAPDPAFHNTIAYAVSPDGTAWEKKGVAIDRGSAGSFDASGVMKPVVVFDGTIFEMFYNVLDGTNSTVGYAVSPDGLNWEKKGKVDSISGWVIGAVKENGVYKVWYRKLATGQNMLAGDVWDMYSASTPPPLHTVNVSKTGGGQG